MMHDDSNFGKLALLMLLLCCFCETTTTLALSSLNRLPPHAGYHGETVGPSQPFFEGWYLRITPNNNDDDVDDDYNGPLAFIFHVFDPKKRPTSKRKGVGMQVLTRDGTIVVESSDVRRFKADTHRLDLKNTFPSGDFYELTPNKLIGKASSSSSEHDQELHFDLDLEPQIGWGGGEKLRQYSTAGWFAALPVFEPHYQILISQGKASGKIRIKRSNNNNNDGEEKEITLKNATLYLEKNWGSSFPSKWWWIQANAFPNSNGNLCVTSTGAKRRSPLLSNDDEEEVALVGIHWNDQFLPFPDVRWTVQWGEWEIHGKYEEYRVTLTGTCSDDDNGVYVRCPTPEGMKETALETYQGKLRVQLYERDVLLVDETTTNACLEIGGLPWKSGSSWKGESGVKGPLSGIVLNRDMERIGSNVLQLASVFVDIPGL